jgi:sulfate adenylyltransferase
LEQSVAAINTALTERGYLERAEPRAHPLVTPTDSRADGRTPTGGIAPHGGVLQVRQAVGEHATELDAEAARLPAIELDPWAVTDLELLAGGGLSPLSGFMSEADLVSVRDRMRLASGLPWSLPVILPAPQSQARGLKVGSRAALVHAGVPLAVLTVQETFAYDRGRLAESVYGTADSAHPGVARTLTQPAFAIAGPVEVIRVPHKDFAKYRHTPTQTRATFADRGWRTVVGFQTRNPVHRAHEYLTKVALEQVDGLLLHPLVGETKDDDIAADVRMRCYEALIENHYPGERVLLAVYPGSMRYAGPREAIFHAIVRQNYGCTHFIVGRDHAGVGSYYGSYDAQRVFDEFHPGEIQIQLLMFEHAFYCRACANMATTKTCPHDDDQRLVLSGTKVRQMLRDGETLPEEFTRPEVAEILRQAELEQAAAS